MRGRSSLTRVTDALTLTSGADLTENVSVARHELLRHVTVLEGAFLLCSFWLVENLARQGRLDDAMDLYESLCARGDPLGLLPEQIDPASGAFLGNYPQAFSHIGVISSGVNLARLIQTRRPTRAERRPGTVRGSSSARPRGAG